MTKLSLLGALSKSPINKTMSTEKQYGQGSKIDKRKLWEVTKNIGEELHTNREFCIFFFIFDSTPYKSSYFKN